jgi:hypothetical protein
MSRRTAQTEACDLHASVLVALSPSRPFGCEYGRQMAQFRQTWIGIVGGEGGSMNRPIFTAAILCILASACSDKGQPAQTVPAPQSAAPASAAPAPATQAATAVAAPNATPAAPDAAGTPALREITIPAGKRISVRLTTAIASDTSHIEDSVRGTIAEPVVVSDTTVVPEGAEVTGTVMDAKRSGRVKGRASVAFRFDRLTVGGERYDIRTARITRVAASSRRDDLKKGGIGAGLGAIVGGIIGGGKGAAIGAGAGGAGAVLATRGNEIRLPAGTTVTTTLQEALTVRPAK